MLFNLFGKNVKKPLIKDLMWLSEKGKEKGLLELLQRFPDAIILAWFQNTIERFELLVKKIDEGFTIQQVRQVPPASVNGKVVILLEHYPLFSKEAALFEHWNATSIIILSSLEDPLLQYFGGASIISVTAKMGLKEEESIEHSMITNALRNAQQKLEKEILIEHSAVSAAEWFRKNVPPGNA